MKRSWVCFWRGCQWMPVLDDNKRVCARCGIVCDDAVLKALERELGLKP